MEIHEIRFDPVLEEWVIISPSRQTRTFLPSEKSCPLCPTKKGKPETEIPESDYEIVVFQNKFPSMTLNPEITKNSEFYINKPAKGICEVICYTPVHSKTLTDQPVEEICHLIEVWKDRYMELGSLKEIKYVLIFENKGKEIGVTITHPHGQIYAFPFIPPKPKRELDSSRKFYRKNGKCLFCQIIENEICERKRIVVENKKFIGFIPFWAHWPYEVHLYPKKHLKSLKELKKGDIKELAEILKELLLKYDRLFNFSFPYIMVIHQAPTDNKNYDYYHFHFEFYPPYRTKDKLKYLAGCETGAWTFINDTIPEEKAEELRNA